MGGSKVYMPTFNKDSTSLESDLTGLGAFGVDSDTYSNMISDPVNASTTTSTLTTPSSATINLDGSHNQLIAGDEAIDTATYKGAVSDTETHTAKQTTYGTVMTMAEWVSAGSKPGPYWVMADDGWAYWAEALGPDSATGLLLDSIALTGVIDQEWYYAIEPVASFATLSDIGLLAASSDQGGQELLDQITKPIVKSLEVIPGTQQNINPGDTIQFTTLVHGDNFPSQDVTYTLSSPAGSPTGAQVAKDPATTIDENTGKLTVGRDELNTGFTITVASVVDPTVTETFTVGINVDSMSFIYDLSITSSDSLFGSSNTDVILPIGDDSAYDDYNNYIVDWGDGTTSTPNTNTHDYAAQPTYDSGQSKYTITVSGRTPGGINFNSSLLGGSYSHGENRLIEVTTPLLQQSSASVARLFEYCRNLTKVPSDLFVNNPQLTNLSLTFYYTSLEAIPDGLFANNTEALVFYQAFTYCTNLKEIPGDLFANNTKATNIYSAFQGCTGLTSIPEHLFENNTLVTTFYYTFYGCNKLTSIPEHLFDNNKAVTNFQGTFYGCTGIDGNLPEWWVDANYPASTYPQFHLDLTDNANVLRMFTGCTNADNYGAVDPDWK
jgi:hypothetical protein